MESILPLPFLPSWDLRCSSRPDGSVTLQQLTYLGSVYLTATDDTIDTLLVFLRDNTSIDAFVDASEVESLEHVVSILDAGARKIWARQEHAQALDVHEGRVYLSSSKEGNEGDTAISDGLLVDLGRNAASYKSTLQQLSTRKVSPVFLTTTDEDLESFADMAREMAFTPILPSSRLTIGKSCKGLVSVPELLGKSWTSDRSDKLMPTVVTDERGVALGLVYSSTESVAESLRTGTGVYQSRKRGLWYKGATSGDTQELVRIALDCDQDCLKFVVRQKGRGMCFLYHAD